MLLKINIAGQKGLTLIEVLAALAILALLAVSFIMMFSTSGLWIVQAGRETIASDYATSIIEVIRAYSNDLVQLSLTPNFEVTDTDDSDQVFSFILGSGNLPLQVDAPSGMKATINISRYNETDYYDTDGDGNQDIDADFKNNLFLVTVTVRWEETGHHRSLPMTTIVGAK